MEPDIREAQEELDKYGIKSVAFNTDKKDTVCHIIGHKQIYADINYNTSDNTNGGNNNATFRVYKNVSELLLRIEVLQKFNLYITTAEIQ